MSLSKNLGFGATNWQADLAAGSHRFYHAIRQATHYMAYVLTRLIYSAAFLLAVLFIGSLIEPQIGRAWDVLLPHGADLFGKLL